MSDDPARQRARMPAATTEILDARTLAASHRRLPEILEPGMAVLDAGCGTGAITRGIADATGQHGLTVGLDTDARLLAHARAQNRDGTNVHFVRGDVYAPPFVDRFDIVTAARVLQWVAHSDRAIRALSRAAKSGGRILILDYDHERIVWTPEPPPRMQRFYTAFLRWRAEAGLDNAIATHLPRIFEATGLTDVVVTPQHEHTERGDSDFDARIRIWAQVAATRGHQMVNDGVVTENDRAAAEAEYRDWAGHSAKSQTLYLLSVEGAVAR